MAKKKSSKRNNQVIFKWVGIVFLVLFAGSILWSMWVDTLRPLLRSGDTAAFINTLIGLPIILLGTAAIVYGGYRVIKSTFAVFGSEQVQDNIGVIRQSEKKAAVRQAQRQNGLAFFRAWSAGGGIMLLGFGLIGLGGWLINQ